MKNIGRRWRQLLALLLLITMTVLTGYPQNAQAARGGDWKEFLANWSSDEEDSADSNDSRTTEKQSGSKSQKKQKKKEKNKSQNKNKTDKRENNKSNQKQTANAAAEAEDTIEEDGSYTSKEDVAAYLHLYSKLPQNFITKKEAQQLGWESSAGNLDKVAPGKSIGGDRFGNYEEQLPDKKGRKYFECDIDYNGGYRGKKRIIYSSDGLIYYTEDHYQTFTQLYDEKGAVR